MTDSTDNIAGQYKHHGPVLTCILNEGAPTVTATGSYYDELSTTSAVLTWATPLARGNMVAIDYTNRAYLTWAATDGLPVLTRAVNGETYVIGRIVSEPKLVNFPATSGVADTIAKRLAAGYYRTALVEIYGGITCVLKAEVYLDGTYGFDAGVPGTLKHNLTGDYADDNTIEIQLITAASGGVGLIPFHTAADAEAGDTVNCLVGITGMLISLTGA